MGVQPEAGGPAGGTFPASCPRSVVKRSSGIPQAGDVVAGGWTPA